MNIADGFLAVAAAAVVVVLGSPSPAVVRVGGSVEGSGLEFLLPRPSEGGV